MESRVAFPTTTTKAPPCEELPYRSWGEEFRCRGQGTVYKPPGDPAEGRASAAGLVVCEDTTQRRVIMPFWRQHWAAGDLRGAEGPWDAGNLISGASAPRKARAGT